MNQPSIFSLYLRYRDYLVCRKHIDRWEARGQLISFRVQRVQQLATPHVRKCPIYGLCDVRSRLGEEGLEFEAFNCLRTTRGCVIPHRK